MRNDGKTLGWEGQREKAAASSSRDEAAAATGVSARLPQEERASAVADRGTRDKGVRALALAPAEGLATPARAQTGFCQCPDPTAPAKEISVQLQDKALAELHPDLKLLEQVHAKQALLLLREGSEVWDGGAATLKVEVLSFDFAREKGTRTETFSGVPSSASVGHQDIRFFRFEKYAESVPPEGTGTVGWTRLSVEVEKTGVPLSGRGVACGTEREKFSRIHDRAVNTIDFFEQVLSGIDPTLLERCQGNLTALRERVSAWTPIDQPCTEQPVRRRDVYALEDKIKVEANLLKEEALVRGKGAPPARSVAFKLGPIHFKHAQPRTLGQAKDVLESDSELNAVVKALADLLAAVKVGAGPAIRLNVYGYADSTGNPDGSGAKSNYDLSERRANWVIKWLEAKLGQKLRGILRAHPCGDGCAPDKGRASPPHRAVLIAEAPPS